MGKVWNVENRDPFEEKVSDAKEWGPHSEQHSLKREKQKNGDGHRRDVRAR